jgi:multidrug resistance efflux pump
MLWRNFVQPVGVVGIAETNAVNVVATQDGLLSALTVERFENVVEGQQIGQLINTDPELLKAQIASAQADVEVLRQRNEVDKDRTEQSYQQFRQSYYTLRFEQASDRVNWAVVSNEFNRVTQEFTNKITSVATYEAAKGKLDTLSTNILERGQQIIDLRKTLDDLQGKQKTNQPDAFEKALEAKAHELDLMLKPTTLKAPISGMVSFVYHRSGERVLRGMPLVTITDPRASRIIGYIRQPIQFHPTTNDTVQITTRTVPRQIGFASILRIGAQVEPINPALLSVDTKRMEAGLPIVISVPSHLVLFPGEFIDLAIRKTRK